MKAPARIDTWRLILRQPQMAGAEAIFERSITRLSALCHPQHRPSRRVLEKCGFVRDETVRPQVEFPDLALGVQQDAVCYVLTVAVL